MARASCTVLSHNVFHDVPQLRLLESRLRLIGDGIIAEQPDVVALQEAARTRRSGDTAHKIAARVNAGASYRYELHYARADGTGEGEWEFEEGLALLSRLSPTLDQPLTYRYSAQVEMSAEVGGQRYRLPDDRVALAMRYRIAYGGEIDVCVTHLTDRPERVGEVPVRLAQARELTAWADRLNRGERPLVIAGDFNDLPESEAIRAITGAGFVDAWAAAGVGPGYTNDRDDLDLEGATAAANQRIDYIFIRPGRRAKTQPVEARLFLDRPARSNDGYLWASDHFGVIAKIEFTS